MPGMNTVDAQRLACPRCRTPMTALLLPSHRGGDVEVDHCAGCRLVWFDRFESVALDGLGWVRLLRTLELGVPRPLLPAAVAQPGCPIASRL